MDVNFLLIFLSLTIIFSYLFDILAKWSKFPSVILLILCGILLNFLSTYSYFSLAFVNKTLPTLGTIGLILIVLEGSMELKLDTKKVRNFIIALITAAIILVANSLVLALFLSQLFHLEIYTSLIYSIPLSIVSSAVAIPSVQNFSQENKEFIIYQSSFSDILGIIFFNLVLHYEDSFVISLYHLGIELVLILTISLLSIFICTQLFEKLTHHIKFFFITAILFFLYAFGKIFHLSSLLLIFLFGIFSCNTHLLRGEKIKKIFPTSQLSEEFKTYHILIRESAFLVRTYFFLFFGLSISIKDLWNLKATLAGLGVVAIIFIIRIVILSIFLKRRELLKISLVAPRGLITILLFYSIPSSFQGGYVNQNLYLIVIFATMVVMVISGTIKTS